MRRTQFLTILICGGISLFLEYRNIVERSILIGDFIQFVPLSVLCVLAIIYLVKNNRQYNDTREYSSFVPSVTALLILVMIFGHMFFLSVKDKSRTVFSATNYDIGSDGGFKLDFKKNKRLKGFKIDRFSTTSYWGSYQQFGDTVILNINLDFEMGKRAVIQDSILRFTDDTVRFYIFRK